MHATTPPPPLAPPDHTDRSVDADATAGRADPIGDLVGAPPALLSQTQEALRASEERYRRIVETTNEGIMTVDSAGRVTFVNQALAAMLGYPVDQILGRPMFDFVPARTLARTRSRFERARTGGSEASEVECVRRDGSVLWALLKTSPIRDSCGAPIGTLAVMTDRTRDRLAEEALRASEEQYRQIVESTTDGIVKTDDAARFVFVNARFAEMVGYSHPELIGASVLAFMDPTAHAAAREAFRQRREGRRGAIDTTFIRKDGTEIVVNVAGNPLFDGDGRFIGTLGVIRDVTETKKLNAQLMVSDRMASVGTLAAGVAHEINNPLAAVIANLDYIGESVARATTAAGPTDAWLRAELETPLDDAREAAYRVRAIVRDLKVFARSPADDPTGPVDVEAVIESSLRMAWNEIRHRARLIKHYGQVPPVQANEARLGQVFLNLIVNAAQALPEGQVNRHEIHVTTRQDGDRVVVEVRDTGAGIAPETIGRIFDAFYTTKAVGLGTGLGLAISHRIVTDLGGALTVESVVGVGTTFRVALPIAAVAEVGIDVTAPAAPGPALAGGRRGRVLVVDDEVLLIRSLTRILGRDHDVTGLTAARPALALCAAGERFDIILCDSMMPEMTGMDLHRELTLIAPDQVERMVFVTGGAFTPAARAFLEQTPREHLDKPFDFGNLRALVQRYVRAS